MVPTPTPPLDPKGSNGVGARGIPRAAAFSPPMTLGARQPPPVLDTADLYAILYRKYNSS